MGVNSTELIAVVKQIHATAKSEAEWRCVCARAYYAVYQDALDFHGGLASPGTSATATGNGRHELFHAQLKNPTIARGPLHTRSMQIGHMLANMHANRTIADYKRHKDLSSRHANESVQQADQVLNLIAGGQPPAPPPPFVASQAIKVPTTTSGAPGSQPSSTGQGKAPALRVIK